MFRHLLFTSISRKSNFNSRTKEMCCSLNLISKNFSGITNKSSLRQSLALPRFYSSNSNQNTSSKLFLIGGLSVIIVTGSVLYMNKNFKENQKKDQLEKARKSLTKVQIGGDFDLIDQKGQRRQSKDFRGQWLMLYFGFVHCPSICPEQLIKMVEIVDSIDNNKNSQNVTPIFVTVDPVRDTPQMLEKYLKEFSPKLVGLTGSPEDIKSVTKKFKIFSSQLQPDKTGNYDIDHSIIMYLLSPEGDYVAHFGQNTSPQEACVKIIKHMKDYSLVNKS